MKSTRITLFFLLFLASMAACTAGSNSDETALPAPEQTGTRSLSTLTPARSQPTRIPPPATASNTPAAPASTRTPLPSPSPTALPPTPTATPTPLTFAVIGDYGLAGPAQAAVATLVDSWDPALILTTGDNNYPDGEAATIDANVGQYYAEYIYPYFGAYNRPAAAPEENRFFPTLGNHDYYSAQGAQPYLDYFTLPGNERYYQFREGPVHFFAINSDFNEPDGVGANSVQAQWLQNALAASDAPWKLVYMHVPPYASGAFHDEGAWMRWPFAEWGASAVLAGHEHHYERLEVDGIPYFVNGLGGGAIYGLGEPLPSSQSRFTGEHGAMRVVASPEALTFEFITRTGEIVDTHTITR